MDKLRTHLAAEASDEEKQAIADAPVEQLREMYGVNHDAVLPVLRKDWDAEGEATTLATMPSSSW
jgi:hypothetical protein